MQLQKKGVSEKPAKAQVKANDDRQLHNVIQKRASEHFAAMNKDVARGQLGGMTKIQVQMKYVIWQMARIEVLYGRKVHVGEILD